MSLADVRLFRVVGGSQREAYENEPRRETKE
jgi:hypothetical protein